MEIHVVELPLKTTPADEIAINKRFYAMWRIHNIMVKHAQKLLVRLEHDPEYQHILSEYIKLLNKPSLAQPEKELRNNYGKQLATLRQNIGFSEYGFQAYLRVAGKKVNRLLSSTQVRKEASRVWYGASKVFFGNGKRIHFKKLLDFDTIGGKVNNNGVVFNKDDNSIKWIKLHIQCKKPNKYILESLNHPIKYCEIKRRMFNNGWHYYVLIYLDGPAPRKLTIGKDTMGIDPGVSSIAGVGDNEVVLQELAPKSKTYNKQIAKLQSRMDISKRFSNPDNYNKDGTIKKGKKTWTFSNTYRKNRRKLKALYRRKSEYTKHTHNALCNALLKHHSAFIVEQMDFKALQKRAKETKRQDKTTNILQKDGSVKSVCKYKRKRRFGKSINDRSPSLFISTLKSKCDAYGCLFESINTQSMKASQYNHITDTYEKVPLSCREKQIGNNTVQRDLYSAFLIRCANSNLTKIDKALCTQSFDHFIEMHDRLISNMKANNISMKQCFGF